MKDFVIRARAYIYNRYSRKVYEMYTILIRLLYIALLGQIIEAGYLGDSEDALYLSARRVF